MAEYLSPHHFELYALAEVPSKGQKHLQIRSSRFFVDKSKRVVTIMSEDSIYFLFNFKGKATALIAPTTRQAQKMKICVVHFAKV